MKITASDSTATLSYSYMAYGCFCAATAELNGCSKNCVALKVYDTDSLPLPDCVCWSLLCGDMKKGRIYEYRCCQVDW